ncbi:MAG: hypothetical protein ACFFCQ_01435 [Promethearchaeota archaeon]
MSKNKEIDQKGSKAWTIPCFPCEFLDLCGVGQDNNPIECVRMNTWIIHRGIIEEETENETETENEKE